MTPITIIALVVVALLTIIISGLTALSYRSCIKAYSMEVAMGKHDDEIKKEYHSKKKRKGGLLGLIGSCIVLLSLISLFLVGITYRACNESMPIGDNVALVIKSGSMSEFHDDSIAERCGNDRSLQFDVGDICIFKAISPEEPLVIGDVYGYKHNSIVITHRLISLEEDGKCRFRGDANPSFDGAVSRGQVIYHYTGTKVPGIGSFVLFAQSYFGIWSLLSTVGVAIGSEITLRKIGKIAKSRCNFICAAEAMP